MKSNTLLSSVVSIFISFLLPQALIAQHEISPSANNVEQAISQTVYVCLGQYAEAYHSRSDCPGLSNCKAEINYTNENYAVYTMKRRPCCRCWQGVYNCKDDAGSSGYSSGGGGGGDDGSALAIAAIVVVSASAIVLSNDFYFQPAYSFKNTTSLNRSGMGFLMGFRKTFKQSALEYGVSHFATKNTYGTYSNNVKWGVHLNYVHNVLKKLKTNKLNMFVGPTINSVGQFGYGGILGVDWTIIGRLKFTARYELSTNTNQLSTGLVFNYQKKYFWKKR